MADEITTGGSDAGDGSAATGAVATPDAIKLSNDSLIHPPGADKPVKYSDFFGGYVPKSEYTRATQRAAEADRQRQALEQQQRQAAAAPPQGQPPADPYASLEALPYLDGKQAAQVMRSIVGALQYRDQVIGLLHQKIQGLEQGFGSMQGRTREADAHSLFAEAQQKAGLPDNEQVKELIQSEYLSHQGWETLTPQERVDQLAQLVKVRVDALRSWSRDADRKQADEARKARFVPGKGGQGLPSKPARGGGFKDPAQMADELWGGLVKGDGLQT